MKCENIILLIHKKIEKKLTLNEEELLNKHLDECSVCQERVALLSKMELLLKKERASAPSNFTQKVLDRIQDKEPFFLSERISHIFFPRWQLVPVAIAVLAILVLPFISKRQKVIMVRFELQLPSAQVVSLAGDFNNWDTQTCKLKRQNGLWAVELPINPGRYQYVFVIDSKEWLPDPKAKNFIDNGFGSKNSVLDTTRL